MKYEIETGISISYFMNYMKYERDIPVSNQTKDTDGQIYTIRKRRAGVIT